VCFSSFGILQVDAFMYDVEHCRHPAAAGAKRPQGGRVSKA